MTTPDTVNLNIISGTLPDLPVPMVSRDNILDTIDTILSEASIVTVSGEEAIGKTTVLSDFARRHGDRAISLFLETTSHWKTDVELARIEIGQQVQ